MERISEHVWWLPPAKPDRPSLCAVVGGRRTLMLDAGSSRAHTRGFVEEIPARPQAVVYTHSHWDHVFGGIELQERGALVVAQRRTVPLLAELAARDWSDDGLAGYRYADDIKEELPAPRVVEIAPVDVVFDDAIAFDLGGVTVRVEHVVSDHCDDACIAFVDPDRLLFLGDALCASPDGTLTAAKLFPLFDRLLGFAADLYVEGHHPAVTSRAEQEILLGKAREAARGSAAPDDDDAQYFLGAFRR